MHQASRFKGVSMRASYALPVSGDARGPLTLTQACSVCSDWH